MRSGDLLHIPSNVLIVEEPLRYMDNYMFTSKPELGIYLSECGQLKGYSKVVCDGQVWLVLTKSIYPFENVEGGQHVSRTS